MEPAGALGRLWSQNGWTIGSDGSMNLPVTTWKKIALAKHLQESLACLVFDVDHFLRFYLE